MLLQDTYQQRFIEVNDIPRTKNGKIVELAVKKYNRR